MGALSSSAAIALLLSAASVVAAVEAPSDFDAIAKAAGQAREAGRVNDAVELYRRAVKLNPEWEEGWFYLGTVLYSSDRNREALEAFHAVLKRRPNNGGAWAFAGMCEFETGHYEAALKSLENARANGVGDNEQLVTLTRYTLGILLNKYSRFDEARRELEFLVQHGHSEPDVVKALGIGALLLPYLPPELPADKAEVASLAGRATALTVAKDAPNAVAEWRELMTRFAKTPNVHYAYGVALLRTDHPDEAMAQFQKELEVTPGHIEARLELVAEYLRRGDDASALPLAREAAQLGPDWYLTRQLLGRALLQSGDYTHAITELETSIELRPDDPQSHFQLARAYRAAGQTDKAGRENTEFQRLDKARKDALAPSAQNRAR